MAFLAWGVSSSESELDSEPEEDELLDWALRFTPVDLAGAGAAEASSSSSSSASLSELEEEDDEEGEGERAGFCSLERTLGASPISMSESLSLSELESLSLSELLLEAEESELAATFTLEVFDQVWKRSSKDGIFCTSVEDWPFFVNSFLKAALAPENPLSVRKTATAAAS